VSGQPVEVSVEEARRIAVRAQQLDGSARGVLDTVRKLGFLQLDPISSVAPPQHLVGCGPEPMLKALAALARRWNVPCHLSLETPMACGVGICFSCVTAVRTACRVAHGPGFGWVAKLYTNGPTGGRYTCTPPRVSVPSRHA